MTCCCWRLVYAILKSGCNENITLSVGKGIRQIFRDPIILRMILVMPLIQLLVLPWRPILKLKTSTFPLSTTITLPIHKSLSRRFPVRRILS
jgi:Na+/H+ antiporter NhaD/arsenite permease-like protein